MLVIELARRQKSLTQADLSHHTRIAANVISLVEQGRGIPNPDQAQRIATVLGIDVSQLLEGVPELEARRA